MNLKYATILEKTATTMRVKGTTPQCGYVDVALTDEAEGDNSVPQGSGIAVGIGRRSLRPHAV